MFKELHCLKIKKLSNERINSIEDCRSHSTGKNTDSPQVSDLFIYFFSSILKTVSQLNNETFGVDMSLPYPLADIKIVIIFCLLWDYKCFSKLKNKHLKKIYKWCKQICLQQT